MSSKADETIIFGNKKVPEDVKRKVLAEKRAHDTVKELLEENITEHFFTDAINLITKEHYNDVVEERAIVHLCGYPLCANKLKNVLSQQYKISSNKVYDITNRKNFCSNACYKASEHVRKQISTTPLWLRDNEEILSVELDSSCSGLKGDEIDLVQFACNEDDKRAESSDGSGSSGEAPEIDTCGSSVLPHDNPHFSLPNSSRTPHRSDQENKATPKPATTYQKPPPQSGTHQVSIDPVLNILKEWITNDSLVYLGYRPAQPVAQDVEADEESKMKVIRKVNKQKLLKEKMNQIVLGDKAPVLPDKAKIVETEAVHIYTRRVEQFYKGHLTSKEVQFQDAKQNQVKADKVETPVYPHVDSRNQTVIRRKILHEKLAKTLQDLMPQLPASVSAHDLKQLITSFQLSSSNIVLATTQYPLMAVMLVILLSKRNADVGKCLLQSEALVNHVTSFYQLSLISLKKRIHNLLSSMIMDR